MSAPSRRRNRSLASCEPCRRRKTRCDHGRPICACCQRRHLRCWYDPAPLTKPSRSPNQTQVGYSCNTRESDYKSSSPPTSIFHSWPYMSAADSSDCQGQTPKPGVYNIKSYDDHLRSIEGIISQLKLLPVIEKRLHSYYVSSQVPLVPRPLMLQLLEAFRSCPALSSYLRMLRAEPTNSHNASQFAKDILASSSTGIVLKPDLSLSAFCALFTGRNLRIETIGLFLTMTARSSLFSMRNGDSENEDLQFNREMGHWGNLSLRLARELSPQSTDLMIWLAHENLQLTTHFEGDASKCLLGEKGTQDSQFVGLAVWRRVGDIATDILAMGLNRETGYSTTPVFLEQCRRRTFAKAYYLDQLYAAVFHRPPRITARHADCRLPWDLSDEDIFGSPAQLEQAKARLTKDGWSMDMKLRTATWVRIRYILAQYREDVTEYQSRRLQQADKAKLRYEGPCQGLSLNTESKPGI